MNDPNGLASPGPSPGQVPQDPVIAALMAAGYPVQPGAAPQTPIPTPAMAGASPDQGGGPVTSPEQVPPPVAPPPQTPATAPPIAAYAPQPPIKPLATGDVKGATAAHDASLGAQSQNVMSTELAKTDALAAHANARAQIYDGHATAQGLIDQQYQVAREKARADANAETAAWMRDIDKKVAEEPVPGRWWANQTKFGQTMYLMSLAFGAMAQAKNPQLKNIALEMITKETEEDMAEQRTRIGRQVDALKAKGQVIDQRLRAQIEDTRDDHTLLVSRLAMVQQAALERANAPGSADQKAAMAEAAQWAGQQRLVIAGERANSAYAERAAKLAQDGENARAILTDKRDRDLAEATIKKDYDLARLQASVKISAKDDPRLKDSVVLPPSTTGIRVVKAYGEPDAGQPVDTPISSGGGLTVSKANEKEARQLAETASGKYVAMKRVSAALAQDGDFTVMAKRDPQLVSDIVKLGYTGVRGELAPGDRVTDADFVAGLEHELGGDLTSLKGRLASATFSAGKDKIKELVDKHLRDYPKNVGHQLGSLLDQATPGYQGNIRVDWTPKSLETEAPGNPSTQEIDASYGINRPLAAPQTVGDLETAQALEKKGVKALPPYRPGSEDKVLKALEDFKGAMPSTIMDRAGKVEAKLSEAGDQRAALEIQQAQYKEVKAANAHLNEVTGVLRAWAGLPETGTDRRQRYLEHNENKILGPTYKYALNGDNGEPATVVDPSSVAELAKYHGITQLTGQDVLDIIKRAGLKPGKKDE